MKEEEYQDQFFSHLSTIRKFLRSKGCDEEEIEEVAQESFIRGYKACSRFFAIRGGFEAWILRIALNELRRQRRAQERAVRRIEHKAELVRRDAPEPEDPEKDESIDYIQAAFETLSPSDRGLLSRTLINGDSPSAIAAEDPSLTRNTVAQRASRARSRLREAFLRLTGS